MSIKDRIAAANARADEGTDDEIVDDLSDLELEFGAVDETEQDDDQEPTPAWEQAAEDDDDGDPLEPSVDGGSAEVPSASDDSSVPDVVSDSDTTGGGNAPQEPEPTPSIDALRGLGYHVEGLTESQATARLAAEFANLAKTYRENQPYIQAGREVAPHWDAFQKFRSTPGQPAAPAAPEQQATSNKPSVEEILSSLGQTPPEPEFRPEWRSHLITRQILFDGEYYTAAPGTTGHVQAIADKMNAHREWEVQAQAQVNRLPEVVRSLAAAVADNKSGLSMEQVEQNLRIKQREQEDEEFARAVLNRNKSWMFETDSKGNILKHPLHGTPIFTPLGLRYYNELGTLSRDGMTDSRKMHYYAMSALGMEIKSDEPPKSVAGGPQSQQTSSNDGAGVSASSAAGTPSGTAKAAAAGPKTPASSSPADRRVELLKTQRNRASRSVNVVSSGQTATTDAGEPHVKKPSIGSMLEDAFVKAGIKPSKRRPKEDDDE